MIYYSHETVSLTNGTRENNMRYIITWIMLKMIPVACPQTEGVHPIMCQEERKDTLTKVFINRSDAFEFYEKVTGPQPGFIGRRGIIQTVKIDSLIIP